MPIIYGGGFKASPTILYRIFTKKERPFPKTAIDKSEIVFLKSFLFAPDPFDPLFKVVFKKIKAKPARGFGCNSLGNERVILTG